MIQDQLAEVRGSYPNGFTSQICLPPPAVWLGWWRGGNSSSGQDVYDGAWSCWLAYGGPFSCAVSNGQASIAASHDECDQISTSNTTISWCHQSLAPRNGNAARHCDQSDEHHECSESGQWHQSEADLHLHGAIATGHESCCDSHAVGFLSMASWSDNDAWDGANGGNSHASVTASCSGTSVTASCSGTKYTGQTQCSVSGGFGWKPSALSKG